MVLDGEEGGGGDGGGGGRGGGSGGEGGDSGRERGGEEGERGWGGGGGWGRGQDRGKEFVGHRPTLFGRGQIVSTTFHFESLYENFKGLKMVLGYQKGPLNLIYKFGYWDRTEIFYQ